MVVRAEGYCTVPATRTEVGVVRRWQPSVAQQNWGQHLWARGYWVASSGNVTDEVWKEYIKNQKPPKPDDDFTVV